jgi:hypothetical protein
VINRGRATGQLRISGDRSSSCLSRNWLHKKRITSQRVPKRPKRLKFASSAHNITASGAVSGTVWRTLIGLIFLMPLAGAVIGAASGAIGGALSDVGME